MKQTITITEDDGVVRVDKHLADTFPEYSRSALAKLFTLNLIKYKGEPIQPGHKLRPGSEFQYDLGPLQEVPDVIPLPIIYEDDDMLVVNKPAGIISHARGRFWQEASVASFIRDRISGMDGERGGIVHRLDRATSGVMVCAKNTDALKMLQKQFSDRVVQKTYIAVVKGALDPEEAIIDAAIARNTKDPKRFRVDKDGKSSQTHYKVIKTGNGYSQVVLTPKTGRTHQLRIHLGYVGHTIVGDELYGGEEADRLLLHAYKIDIKLPSGDRKVFEAPVPKELEEKFA
jgi:23S rRNA pseudouridine1911/1915/1917 synthase